MLVLKTATEEKTLMMEDLSEFRWNNPPPPRAIHMVVLDSKPSTASVVARLRRGLEYNIIGLEPEQESVEGVWRWKPLVAGVA